MLDSIETLIYMLRDPMYWEFEVGLGQQHQMTAGYVWHSWQRPHPPVTAERLKRVEEKWRVRLPPLLRRIYLEVSNGGIGPELNALENADSSSIEEVPVVEIGPGVPAFLYTTTEYDEESGEEYERENVFPIALYEISEGGCQDRIYINCAEPGFPVLHCKEVEHLPRPIEPITLEGALQQFCSHGYHILAPSFNQWIEDWVADFQQKYNRWYTEPEVLESLYSEPHYLRAIVADSNIVSHYEVIPLSRWQAEVNEG